MGNFLINQKIKKIKNFEMMYIHPTSTKVSVQPPTPPQNPKINQTIKIIKVFDFFFEFLIVLYYNLKSDNRTHTHTNTELYYIRFFLVASCCSRWCVLAYFEFQIIKIFKVEYFFDYLINYGFRILCYGQTHFHTDTRTHGHSSYL